MRYKTFEELLGSIVAKGYSTPTPNYSLLDVANYKCKTRKYKFKNGNTAKVERIRYPKSPKGVLIIVTMFRGNRIAEMICYE